MKRLLTIILISLAGSTMAQLTPLKGIYYQNPFLINPSMAGSEEKVAVYAEYADQWNRVPGSPKMFAVSASTPIFNNASVGVNVMSDKAGLLQKTQAMASFAYKVKLSDEQNLRFGVSLTWAQDKLDNSSATANGANDPALTKYNSTRDNYLDGNFGATYQNHNLEVQFSYMNLNQNRGGEISSVDYMTFYSSIGYKISLDETFNVKPLVAYRGIKGYKNQFDLAAEWGFQDFQTVKLYSMYHSNKSFTGGIGFQHKSGLGVTFMYNSEPSEVSGLTGGIFDIGIGCKF